MSRVRGFSAAYLPGSFPITFSQKSVRACFCTTSHSAPGFSFVQIGSAFRTRSLLRRIACENSSSSHTEGMTEDQSAAHHFSSALFRWSAGVLAGHVAPREPSNSFRGVCSIMEQAQGVGRCALSLWPPRTAVLHERRSYQRSQLSIFAASFSGPTTAMPSRPSFRHSPATACTSARVTAMMRCSISIGHSTRP